MNLKNKICKIPKLAILTTVLWLFLSCSMFLAYRNEWKTGNSGTLNLFGIVLYLAMSAVLVLTTYMLCKKKTLEWIFVVMVLLLGMIQLFVIPISALPDSNSHLVTVYSQSSKLLGIEAYDEDGNVIVDSDVIWNTGLTWYATKEDYVQYIKGALGQSDAVYENLSARKPLGTKHPGYLPQILGVTLARAIGMVPEQIIHMGRIFALLFYCFIMYWAIKKIPFCKTTLFIIGSLPMTLQQAVSYNYDSVLNGICLLTISWLLYLIFDAEKIKLSDILFLIIATISIATIKFIYLPILGIALLIPKDKFGGLKNKIFSASGIVILGTISLLISKLTMIQGSAVPGQTTGGKASISLLWILQNPITTMEILYRTIERYLSMWIEGLLASPLGYFDDGIDIPSVIVYALLFILILSALKQYNDNQTIQFTKKEKIWMLFIIAIVSLLIMVGILCDTAIGADAIWGIQGRYFLPVLPLIMLLIQNNNLTLKHNIDSYLILLTGFLNCMTMFFYTLAVVRV